MIVYCHKTTDVVHSAMHHQPQSQIWDATVFLAKNKSKRMNELALKAQKSYPLDLELPLDINYTLGIEVIPSSSLINTDYVAWPTV